MTRTFGLLVTALLSADAGAVTTVIVVRHAEKATASADMKGDPPLTEAGTARAKQLVTAVEGLKPAAVLSTDTARTRATAAPVAERFKLQTELVDAKPAAVAAAVRRHAGQTVLVVGHSNTVPAIVVELGAPRPNDLCDGEFDNLYVVRVPASGPATVEQKKYGAKTVDDSCRPK